MIGSFCAFFYQRAKNENITKIQIFLLLFALTISFANIVVSLRLLCTTEDEFSALSGVIKYTIFILYEEVTYETGKIGRCIVDNKFKY